MSDVNGWRFINNREITIKHRDSDNDELIMMTITIRTGTTWRRLNLLVMLGALLIAIVAGSGCAFLITSPTLCPNFENSYVPHVQLSRSEETWQILETLRYPAKNSVLSSFAGFFLVYSTVFFTSIDQPIYSTFTQAHAWWLIPRFVSGL